MANEIALKSGLKVGDIVLIDRETLNVYYYNKENMEYEFALFFLDQYKEGEYIIVAISDMLNMTEIIEEEESTYQYVDIYCQYIDDGTNIKVSLYDYGSGYTSDIKVVGKAKTTWEKIT